MSSTEIIAATPPAAKARRRQSPSPHRSTASVEVALCSEAADWLSTPRANPASSQGLHPESALKAPRPPAAVRGDRARGSEPSTPKRRPCGGSLSDLSGQIATVTPGATPRVSLRQVDLAGSEAGHKCAAAYAEPLQEAARLLAERLVQEEKEENCGGSSWASPTWAEFTTHAISGGSQPNDRPVGLLCMVDGSSAPPHGVPSNVAELPAEVRSRASVAPDVIPILKKIWIEPSQRQQGLQGKQCGKRLQTESTWSLRLPSPPSHMLWKPSDGSYVAHDGHVAEASSAVM
eukprot:CAMPEP_0115186258 /NCGR_PEP_ID=MMETSP0270-20121206/9890_1 /TAXON_ID=71861 /ORGANISM="Scrippsiella trochoidea, Strain CCMP3099" /LENGTH=289 /DNA_ID=CAMNT_0002599379 /DNA_START=14 /DNA_END=884 /DNA_ORIENTATION=-